MKNKETNKIKIKFINDEDLKALKKSIDAVKRMKNKKKIEDSKRNKVA